MRAKHFRPGVAREAARVRRAGLSRGCRAAWGLGAVLGLLLAAQVAAASAALSEAAAQSLELKIAELTGPPNSHASGASAIVITEDEANSYLRLRGGSFLPQGVHNPTLRIAPDILSATAVVDFDEFGRKDSDDTTLGAKAFSLVFRGRQPVHATGKLETANGRGTLRVESLTVGSTSIPPAFVQYLLESYVERRYGVDLSKSFPLPEGISHIELGQRRATFHRAPQSTSR